MARAFKRMAREARGKKNTNRVLNWAHRLHQLEVAVFELHGHIGRELRAKDEESLTDYDKDLLQAGEDFRAHLKTVLEATDGAQA